MAHQAENPALAPEQELLVQIEAFLKESNMGASYFGKKATGNSELVRRLRTGKGCTLKTMAKAQEFMLSQRVPAKSDTAA